MTTQTCQHLGQIVVVDLPLDIDGCEECMKIGSSWVQLRMCLTCGKIGCCDDSPQRHARRHWQEQTRPLIRSAEPGESWDWCFADEVAVGAVRRTS